MMSRETNNAIRKWQSAIVSPFDDRVLRSSRRSAHHAVTSGYDIFGPLCHPFDKRTALRYDRCLSDFLASNQRMTGDDRTGVALELRAAAHMATHCDYLYDHYMQNRFNYWSIEWRRGHRVVCFVLFTALPLWPSGSVAGGLCQELAAAIVFVVLQQVAFFQGFDRVTYFCLCPMRSIPPSLPRRLLLLRVPKIAVCLSAPIYVICTLDGGDRAIRN